LQTHSAKAALFLFCGLSLQAVSTTQALAQQAAGVVGSTPFQAAAPVASSSSAGSMIWFSAVTLALLSGLVVLVAWLLRKNFGASAGPSSGIRIMSSQSVGPRERLLVVRVGNRGFLVGHTPTQVNLVAELDPEDLAAIPQQAAPIEFSAGFGRQLAQLFSRKR
jgi:flagellar protein FliO/FliZ